MSRDSAARHVGRVGVNLGGAGPRVELSLRRLRGSQCLCWAHGFSHSDGLWSHLGVEKTQCLVLCPSES